MSRFPFSFPARLIRAVDGDTLDLRLDLGFSLYHLTRVRILGIDTLELRSRDPKQKAAAQLAQDEAARFCEEAGDELRFLSHELEGKYGRPLGDMRAGGGGELLTEHLVAARLAVRYAGGDRAALLAQHEANVGWLRTQGLI